MQFFFLRLFTVFILVGCGQSGRENRGASEVLLPSGKDDFRGHNIGDHKTDVEKREDPSTSVYSMPDELIYRVPLSGMGTSWYEVSYQFSEHGLYDIRLEVYAATDSVRNTLAKEICAHYTKKFGDFRGTDHYKEWRIMSAEGRIVAIAITDTLVLKNKPALRIKYEEEYGK